MLEIIGVLFAAQGIGGIVNYIVGDGPSWFLVNHIAALEDFRLPLHILFTLIGLALIGVPEWKKWRQRQDQKRAGSPAGDQPIDSAA